jgi:hypothetical protein
VVIDKGFFLLNRENPTERLSKNFIAREFMCKCGKCQGNKISVELIGKLQKIRDAFGTLTITSGYRCPVHNASIGGAKDSQHVQGNAADMVSAGAPIETLFKFIRGNLNHKGGVGFYKKKNFIHMDVRPQEVTWGDKPFPVVERVAALSKTIEVAPSVATQVRDVASKTLTSISQNVGVSKETLKKSVYISMGVGAVGILFIFASILWRARSRTVQSTPASALKKPISKRT